MVILLGSLSFSLEVVFLICRCRSNKQPGHALVPGEGFVKNYVTAIPKSLNVINRMQAVIAAQECGLTGDTQ
jgi:DNA-binding NarL/FixJ family response regulator